MCVAFSLSARVCIYAHMCANGSVYVCDCGMFACVFCDSYEADENAKYPLQWKANG